MTEIEKQNLQSEKAGLKMDLIFNDEFGANIVAEYVVAKESGETPTIDIATIKAKRTAIKARMKQIDDTFSGINIDITVNLINCSQSGRTGTIKNSFIKANLKLEDAQLNNIVGTLNEPTIILDGVLLIKDIDYTFSDNSLKATNTGLNKIKSADASVLKIEITGE